MFTAVYFASWSRISSQLETRTKNTGTGTKRGNMEKGVFKNEPRAASFSGRCTMNHRLPPMNVSLIATAEGTANFSTRSAPRALKRTFVVEKLDGRN